MVGRLFLVTDFDGSGLCLELLNDLDDLHPRRIVPMGCRSMMTPLQRKEAVLASVNLLMKDLLQLIISNSQEQMFAEEKRRRFAEEMANNEARRHSDWFT